VDRSIICPINKHKGARDDPASYRMICLLSHSYKIFAVILVQGIQKIIEATIKDRMDSILRGVAVITSTSSESY